MLCAPLEIHSNPKEPTPENKSKIFDFSKLIVIKLECFNILNIYSLVKSFNGLVS